MEIAIRRGDDFHAHLREEGMLKKVSPFSNLWGRITAMGNLSKPIATAHDVIKYRNQILQFTAQQRLYYPAKTKMDGTEKL